VGRCSKLASHLKPIHTDWHRLSRLRLASPAARSNRCDLAAAAFNQTTLFLDLDIDWRGVSTHQLLSQNHCSLSGHASKVPQALIGISSRHTVNLHGQSHCLGFAKSGRLEHRTARIASRPILE